MVVLRTTPSSPDTTTTALATAASERYTVAMMNDNFPDFVERAELDAEQKDFYARQAEQERRRLNSLTPEQRAAEWDRANAESIALGYGPLPF